jgi:hypothetical protein
LKTIARSVRREATSVTWTVAGHGLVRASLDQIPGLRRPASLLKQADEQTVVGLAAVSQAIERAGLAGTCFTDWGILAAPRYLGRAATIAALDRFAAEGAWGVSPHLIPHRSLHSQPGTISMALQSHGPNLGVGGGPEGAAEALLAAAALCSRNAPPGLWLVLTGWDHEPVPNLAVTPVCLGLALALVAGRPGDRGPRLSVHAEVSGRPGPHDPTPLSLETLLGAFETPPSRGCWPLHGGGWVELEPTGAGAEK